MKAAAETPIVPVESSKVTKSEPSTKSATTSRIEPERPAAISTVSTLRTPELKARPAPAIDDETAN